MRGLKNGLESLFPRLFKNSRKDSSYEQDIRSYICEQLGRKPKHIGLYVQAMTHSSYKSGGDQHFSHVNERLEYLGDALWPPKPKELLIAT